MAEKLEMNNRGTLRGFRAGLASAPPAHDAVSVALSRPHQLLQPVRG